ncbi:hypothetical protein IQ273_14355 [Nodosilinea sp. LEGE 07298]|uniref:NB-ARC domain-containing protein n=1 Tax=Nodosilinea sp. LEGE 07298 TaxID=2777970 RepID=UPI0018803C84|nr:NB-ARC domain-containing protein [Nodosilinea sp. LEGE 07298]MBE9110599.1 hypothetical protein [Nodosilinea sp. LEGE 07298]
MNIAQGLRQQWLQRIASEHPEINAEDREAIVNWLLGESPERLTGLTEPDQAIARQAIEYRYRILQQRYLNVNSEQGYQRLVKRLSSLFLIRNKIKAWVSLSRDRRRTVVDVIQEVIQEMMRSDRHLTAQITWISTFTHDSRLRNVLMLASIEEYCLRPIRRQPLIVYRFVNYLRRSQKGGMTGIPTGELIHLVSLDPFEESGDELLDLSLAFSMLRNEVLETVETGEVADESSRNPRMTSAVQTSQNAELFSDSSNSIREIIEAEESSIVKSALNKLQEEVPKYAEIISLRLVDELKWKEVREVLKQRGENPPPSEKILRGRLKRAKSRFQKIFQEYESTVGNPRYTTPNNIPIASQSFVGRDEELKIINKSLEDEVVVIVQGTGGIGKTELCKQYAIEHLFGYSGGICWVLASGTESGLIDQIISFSKKSLGGESDSADTRGNRERVFRFSESTGVMDTEVTSVARSRVRFQGTYWHAVCPYNEAIKAGENVYIIGRSGITLQVVTENYWEWNIWPPGRVLIVLDDVRSYEQIKPYLPPPGSRFRVLATTRQVSDLGFLKRLVKSTVKEKQIIKLSALTPENSLELLSKNFGESILLEQEIALKICEYFCFHPLALTLLSAYINDYSGISLRQIYDNLEKLSIKPEIGLRDLESSESLNKIFKELNDQLQKEDEIRYSLELSSSKDIVLEGEIFEVHLELLILSDDTDHEPVFSTLNKHGQGNDINILLNAPGFQVEGNSVGSLPLDSTFDLTDNIGRIVFKLTALYTGDKSLSVELYRDSEFISKLEIEIYVKPLSEAIFPKEYIKVRTRPIAQPSFIFNAKPLWHKNRLSCRIQYEFKILDNSLIRLGDLNILSEEIPVSLFDEANQIFKETIKDHASPCDEWLKHIRYFGHELFKKLIPFALQDTFRLILSSRQNIFALFLTEQETAIPWEFLSDGKHLLSECLIIGRWFQDMSNSCWGEIPIGSASISYFESVKKHEDWAKMLNSMGSPSPKLLPSGMLDILSVSDSIQGLHILREDKFDEKYQLSEAPILISAKDNINKSVEQQIQNSKLNIYRNHPLVTLSYTRGDKPNSTDIEYSWAPTFVRAGASAFVGPLWSVDPAVDAAFISTFYTRLWMGDALGQAFHTARQMARIAVPESCDWLAYVLYGDPMARPYRPIEGKGYAVVEPIGQDIKDSLPPNQSLRFRLTLRRDPPVWHEDRLIEVAEDLAFDNLQVHIVAFGLEVNPTTVDMSHTPNGNYLGWFTLSAPPNMAGETVPVQVHFADGAEPIHSVTFALQIAAGEGE